MINDLIVNYQNNPKINNIDYGKMETINSFTKKMHFYNPDVMEPLHKFWYYIQNAKIVKKTPHNMTIALSNNDISLIESIKSLDQKTNNILTDILKNRDTLCDSIKFTKNYPPTMTIDIDDESIFFNSTNDNISYKKINANSKIQLYIKFDCVIITSSEYFFKWKILQMKEIKNIDFTTKFFHNNQNLHHISKSPQVPDVPQVPLAPPILHMVSEQYPPHNICSSYVENNAPLQQNIQNINTAKKYGMSNSANDKFSFQPPTQSELLEMIGKLKKTTSGTADLKTIAKKYELFIKEQRDILKHECIESKKLNNTMNDICNKIRHIMAHTRNSSHTQNQKIQYMTSENIENDPFYYEK